METLLKTKKTNGKVIVQNSVCPGYVPAHAAADAAAEDAAERLAAADASERLARR